MEQSKEFRLNSDDWKQIGRSAFIWSWGVFAVYFGQLTGVIQVRGGLEPQDFIPTAFTLGVMAKYVMDRLQNIYNSFTTGK